MLTSQLFSGRAINRFVRRNKSTGSKNYDSYEMVFIKESSEINEKSISANPAILNTSGFSVHEDLIYIYDWEKGAFKGKLRFENGKIVDTVKNINEE